MDYFRNEAGSGSAPCAAARQNVIKPVKPGLIQALGVFVDTIVICSCTAMIVLLVPEKLVAGKKGMDLFTDCDEISSGRIRMMIFICGDLIPVQFFYISGNSLLCKM